MNIKNFILFISQYGMSLTDNSQNKQNIILESFITISPEFAEYQFIRSFTMILDNYLYKNKNMIKKIISGNMETKFELLCKISIEALPKLRHTKRESKFWKVTKEAYFNNNSTLYAIINIEFINNLKKYREKFELYKTPYIQEIIHVFCKTFEMQLGLVTKYNFITYSKHKEWEVFSLYIKPYSLSTVVSFSNNISIHIRPNQNLPNNSYKIAGVTGEKQIQNIFYLLDILIDQNYTCYLNLYSDFSESLIFSINTDVFDYREKNKYLDMDTMTDIIYEQARVFILTVFVNERRVLRDNGRFEKHSINFNTQIIFYNNKCEKELLYLSEFLHKKGWSDENIDKILLLMSNVFSFITFITFYAIYDIVSFNETGYKEFIVFVSNQNNKSFMTISRIFDDKTYFRGDFSMALELLDKTLNLLNSFIIKEERPEICIINRTHLIIVTNSLNFMF